MSDERHILIVEDEKDLADVLAYNLKRAGYRTTHAADGRQAVDLATSRNFDLILLDVMLPGLAGTEVATRIRTQPATSHTPIIMLTAKGDEVDQLVGLTVGADDYITKPFSTKVLLARIEAVLRRAAMPRDASSKLLRIGAVEMNTETHEATAGGEQLKFTLTEFRLLAALLQAKGRVLSRAALINKAMGPGIMVTERTIDVHMTSVRKKLGEHAGFLLTVRGVGYRAAEDATAEA